MTATATHVATWNRRAVAAATRAPSVYNTQPWRFRLREDGLDLLGDPSRRLAALDPSGREYLVSLGAALFNARVSYAASGVVVDVERTVGAVDDVGIARLRVVERPPGAEDERLALLEPSVLRRQSCRRPFFPDPVGVEAVDDLVASAALEDALLVPVEREERREALARLVQQADREQNADPAYRAELRRWTHSDPASTDGITPLVVPAVDGLSGDEVPLRDFDTYGTGWLPGRTHSDRNQCLLLLTTAGDEAPDWVRAGEALERVLLRLTHLGFSASLFSQPVEVTHVRERLRDELGLVTHPQILLRVGRAALTPASLRRPVRDVLVAADTTTEE